MPIQIEQHEDAEAMIDRVLASLGDRFGEEPLLSTPYPVETVELKSLAGGSLEYAPTSRWQCLVGDEKPSAAVDLARDGEDYFVVSISHGKLATGFNDAVRIAEERHGDSELLLSEIEIPGLHLAAARLVDADSGAELFIPFLPLPGENKLTLMATYEPERLIAVLQEEAARVLDMGMEMGTGAGS